MWDAIYVGFELMSKLFLTGNISDEIVCKEVQHQLCNSTSQGVSKVLPNSDDAPQISELFDWKGKISLFSGLEVVSSR